MAKILIGVLLAVHVAWICTHLTLVSKELIDPWKLGGYGMYTVPHSFARSHVYLYDQGQQDWHELEDNQANSFAFDTANHLPAFRCRIPTEASIVGFLDDNPHLRFKPITLALSEVVFSRDPIGSSRKLYGNVEIAWGGTERFGYRGDVCGKAFDGSVDYSPPT
ncbi:MAG: hypothetical protein AAF501_02350 [Pseudomonadota bacterium]